MKTFAQIAVAVAMLSFGTYASVQINNHVAFNGYEKLYLLPLLYMFLFIFILNPLLFSRFNTFLMTYSAVSFLRYMILPFLIVESGWYIGRSPVNPLSSSFELAIELMLWELLLAMLAVGLFFGRKKVLRLKMNETKKVALPESYTVYVAYILISIVVLALAPEVVNSFAFIMPHDNMIDIGAAGFKTSIAQFVLITAKYILFLLMMTAIYRQYEKAPSFLWIFISFLIVLLNICILFGDNRSDFLISAIASLYLFYRLYVKRALPFIIGTTVLLFIVFMNITTYRNTVTITNGVDRLVDVTDTLQIYAGGPYNVAMATELSQYFPYAATAGNFLYDLARPFIGLNIFLRDVDGFQFSNYLFNYRIYFDDHVAQILPMVGQGYFYSGFLFAPFLDIVFVAIAYMLYRIMMKGNRIELIFFLSIPITRIGFMMGQNGSILLNDISFTLLLNILIYVANNYVVLKRREVAT